MLSILYACAWCAGCLVASAFLCSDKDLCCEKDLVFFPLTNWNEQRRHFDTLRCNSLSLLARCSNSSPLPRYQTPTECISHGRKLHHAISVLSATCINPSVHARSAALCNNPFSILSCPMQFCSCTSLSISVSSRHSLPLSHRRRADSAVGRNCLTLSKHGVFYLKSYYDNEIPFSNIPMLVDSEKDLISLPTSGQLELEPSARCYN